MPKIDDSLSNNGKKETPEALKPFTSHGMTFLGVENKQASANCPFCDSHKFYVNTKSGLWDCKVCGIEGNPQSFLEYLWQNSQDRGDDLLEDYEKLAKSRSLLRSETLTEWGVVQSISDDRWLVPGYNQKGNLCNLYRWVNLKSEKTGEWKYKLIPTGGSEVGIKHGMFMPQDSFKTLTKVSDIWIVEGVWNAMALWEVVTQVWEEEQPFIVGIPGANVFSDTWLSLFKGKKVTLFFDNDHPRLVKKKMVEGAAYIGLKKRIAELTTAGVEEIRYLKWGEYGHDLKLPSGYDIRDLLGSADSIEERHTLLSGFLDKVVVAPKEFIEKAKEQVEEDEAPPIEVKPCHSYKELINAWRKALKWGKELDKALSCMLACIASTRSVGDQLWIRLISCAGTGKSTLAEGITVSRRFALAKSTIRGFHSGFSRGDNGDNSLISKMKDKTLIIKDGDTLLRAPNKDQILSEMRDIYDRVSRVHYRNGVVKDYAGINSTIIICGTGSLRELDSSELGQRYLDVVMMDEINEDHEDEVLWRVANRVSNTVSIESNGQIGSHYDPATLEAMQLTGGYVEYLRDNSKNLLTSVSISDETLRQCIGYGKFVAYMRARPSRKHDESAEREFAARLVGQHVKLAKCLAVAKGKQDVDEEIVGIVRSIAFDTAKGLTLEIFRKVYETGEKGVEDRALALVLNQDETKLKSLLRFLRKIKVLEVFNRKLANGIRTSPRWRVTEKVRKLYEEVTGDDNV